MENQKRSASIGHANQRICHLISETETMEAKKNADDWTNSQVKSVSLCAATCCPSSFAKVTSVVLYWFEMLAIFVISQLYIKGSYHNSKPVKVGKPSHRGGVSDFPWFFPT